MTNDDNMSDKTRKYQCTYCEKKFLGSNDLTKHTRIHTGERPYVCHECGKGFKQKVCLRNHIACKHSPDLQSQVVYICEYCDKHFPIKERLRLHLRTHTGGKQYTCEVCKKMFAHDRQLARHMRVHNGTFKKTFHCDICNKDLKGHLPEHMRTHKKEKPHGCTHCGARFAQSSQLTVHQRIHSGEKPYQCQVCRKAFAHSTALKLHTRSHTGEKPFQCAICRTGFSQLPHLKKHMMCIHKSNKSYACSHCKSFFRTKVELNKHLEICKAFKKQVKTEKQLETGNNVNAIDTPMTLEKMRYLLAVLLKKISAPDRLNELRFNKRLIDDILIESIENSGREACKEVDLSVAEKLKRNIQILLEWTVPKTHMKKFKLQQRSTEELLEELTSKKSVRLYIKIH